MMLFGVSVNAFKSDRRGLAVRRKTSSRLIYLVRNPQEREPKRKATAHVQNGLLAQGDPLLLSIVIQNLMENAWKFSAKQVTAKTDIGSTAAIDGESMPRTSERR